MALSERVGVLGESLSEQEMKQCPLLPRDEKGIQGQGQKVHEYGVHTKAAEATEALSLWGMSDCLVFMTASLA